MAVGSAAARSDARDPAPLIRLTIQIDWAWPTLPSLPDGPPPENPPIVLEPTGGARILDVVARSEGLSAHPLELEDGTWRLGFGRSGRVRARVEAPLTAQLLVRAGTHATIDGLASAEAIEFLGERADAFRDEVELVRGASPQFSTSEYLAGRQTPVFFGSAINNFGVTELLSAFVRHAPGPLAVLACETSFVMVGVGRSRSRVLGNAIHSASHEARVSLNAP